MSLIPIVVEKTQSGERSFDIFSRCLQDNIVFLNGPISTEMSHVIVAQLLFLESKNPEKDIFMYINSPGGQVTAGLAIYDCIQYIKPDVSTVVIGQASSMGSLIAQAGSPGKRLVLPESRTMIHRVSSGTSETSGSVHVQELQLQDAIRNLEEAKRLNIRLTELYVKHNTAGKTFDDFTESMRFDTFLSAQEAVDFGLADKIVASR